jgi:iron complex transport system substrate-binding protein
MFTHEEDRMTRPTRATSPLRFRLLVASALALVAAAALVVVGCSGPGPTTSGSTSGGGFPVTITDDASRSVTVKAEPKRIVSLAPANTETLFALGQGRKVVGVTSYDDYPSQVASITKVGDFAGPNVEAIAAAKPDLILATSGVQADVVAKLEALGATVVVLDPQTLDGVYTDIARVGAVTGATKRAAELVSGMQSDVQGVAESVAGSPTVKAFIEIGQNPLYTAGTGTLMDELISRANGTNVVTQPGYVSYSAEQLISADPQVYFATKGSSSNPKTIEKRPGYSAITAIKDKRVVILDDSIVSRGGPRIVDGLKAIAEGLHPGVFPTQ